MGCVITIILIHTKLNLWLAGANWAAFSTNENSLEQKRLQGWERFTFKKLSEMDGDGLVTLRPGINYYADKGNADKSVWFDDFLPNAGQPLAFFRSKLTC